MNERIRKILEDSYVNPLEEVDYPPTAINCGYNSSIPISIGTYGNFSFVQAPPKSKKTFFLTLLSAAYMGAKPYYVGQLEGNRERKKLIHYDTEQGTFHAQKTFRRVFNMCDNVTSYFTYALREYSALDRLQFIDWHLSTLEDVGVVVIDGIADLIEDVNNIVEANKLTQHLMKWTQKYNIHLITAIHSNYNSDKPTGHLGSFLEKKAETQIILNPNEDGFVEVRCKRSRGFSFEDFCFRINKEGLPYVSKDVPESIHNNDFLSV